MKDNKENVTLWNKKYQHAVLLSKAKKAAENLMNLEELPQCF